ncbi:MAG: hypothetical protein ACKO23_02885, partial [Gemmataceae bacterium]
KLQQDISDILRKGYDHLERGSNGLKIFLGKFEVFTEKIRRRGGQPNLRRALDGISYLAKCSFYLCYANCWIDLLPWLRQHQDLGVVSERFHRFWHMQNQPREDGHGGILPDVLRGQVLSLHPLSGFFMKDPALCAIAGRFFGTDAYDRVFHRGEVDCAEYWHLVDAIVTAGHSYQQALQKQIDRRGVHTQSLSQSEAASLPDQGNPSRLLEEYAATKGIRCPTCNGPLRLDHYQLDPDEPHRCLPHFVCPTCHLPVSTSFDEDEMRAWLCQG